MKSKELKGSSAAPETRSFSRRPALQPALKARLASLGILACLVLVFFGAFWSLVYSGPMLTDDFIQAAQAPVGDSALALYDRALDSYRNESYMSAKFDLTQAYNDLTRDTGVVPASKKKLAARIQMLLGVVDEHQKNYRLAISAYEECLRQEPANLAAKYNLERLKSQYPDISSGGKKKPSSGSGKDKKKGI